jgi:putative copper export protein
VLSPSLDTLRIFLHVLAATVWVGGQLTLAGLVPTLRSAAPDVVPVAARRFNRIAWPAFGVLVATGIWNLVEVDLGSTSTAYQVTLMVKLVVVALSGVGAAVHVVSRSKVALAVGGSLAGLGAVGALFLGVLLTRGV